MVRASLIAQLVKNPPAMQETPVDSWVGKIWWRRDRLPTPIFFGFPCGSAGKESTCSAGDPSLIPGLGISAGEETGCLLQYPWASLVAQLVKNLPAMREDLGSIPGLGRFSGERKGYSLQYSGLKNSMDCIVHGVAKSRIQLSNFHFHGQDS